MTNTKTLVRETKQRLGILGNPKEEDLWAQFNRTSKRVYDSHMSAVDVGKTWKEVPFELRERLVHAVYRQTPDGWRRRIPPDQLMQVCDVRLFRLHHVSRHKRTRALKLRSGSVGEGGATGAGAGRAAAGGGAGGGGGAGPSGARAGRAAIEAFEDDAVDDDDEDDEEEETSSPSPDPGLSPASRAAGPAPRPLPFDPVRHFL